MSVQRPSKGASAQKSLIDAFQYAEVLGCSQSGIRVGPGHTWDT